MTYSNYDLESLWFEIYRTVIKHNAELGDNALDRSQLREVATSIFIAYTQRGITRPVKSGNGFIPAVVKQLTGVKNRETQKQIFKTIKQIKNNGGK